MAIVKCKVCGEEIEETVLKNPADSVVCDGGDYRLFRSGILLADG